MIPLPFLAHSTVLVVGLGKSGTATARALGASGARVLVWDDNPAAREAAVAEGLRLADPEDLAKGMAGLDLVLWSPGIPHTHPKPHPIADHARAAGLPLVCDVELLGRACPSSRYLAITGTNGKSTTTSLLGHILQTAGIPCQVGGNLGIPVLELEPARSSVTPAPSPLIPATSPVIPAKAGIQSASTPDLAGPALDSRFRGNDEEKGRGNDEEMGRGNDHAWYVLELSSYQLELIDRIRFDVAVLLNITPDHLARHGGMDGYVAAKRRAFAHLKAGGTAVIGVDDEQCRAMAASLPGRVVPISAERAVAGGVYVLDGVLIDDTEGAARPVLDLKPVATLPGRHNGQNAAAAFAAARAAGVPEDVVCAAIRSFPGLAHRQQRVGEVAGVLYVNDSKATNADAVEKALLCYQSIYWILGGQAKEGGIAPLAPHFDRIRHAFLIGEAAPAFARTLEGKVPFTQCGTLDVAVAKAAAMAEPGSVVLLSPACASWDQFKSFEHRGDAFRRQVEALAGER